MKSKLSAALAAAMTMPPIAMICLAASVAVISGARAETTLERGSYLVNAIMACDGCHTPRPGGGEFGKTKRFSGSSPGLGRATLSRQRRQYFLRSHEWHRRLERHRFQAPDVGGRPAKRREGRPADAVCLLQEILTPRDLDAVSAYIRSIAPQSNQKKQPVYKAAMHYEDIPGGEKPFTDEALNEPLRRGFYIATIAHCMECHARRPDGTPGYRDSWARVATLIKAPTARSKCQTSRRTRRRVSAPSAIRTSSGRSRKGSAATAASSSHPSRARNISAK